MRPLLARAKCSGTVPFLLLRPPYCLLNAPTPMFCFMYTFLASDAAFMQTWRDQGMQLLQTRGRQGTRCLCKQESGQ